MSGRSSDATKSWRELQLAASRLLGTHALLAPTYRAFGRFAWIKVQASRRVSTLQAEARATMIATDELDKVELTRAVALKISCYS